MNDPWNNPQNFGDSPTNEPLPDGHALVWLILLVLVAIFRAADKLRDLRRRG